MNHLLECDCDRCLLALMQSKDFEQRQKGWEIWYQRDGAKLLAYMERRFRAGHSIDHSEDLVQDCFVIGFRNISGGRFVDCGKSLCAYLFGIARRLLYEHSRLCRRETGFPFGEDIEIEANEMELADRVCVEEILKLVKGSCERQPVLSKWIVSGLYVDGKSPDQLALEFSKSAGNIRTIAHRSIHVIIQDLAQQGVQVTSEGVRYCLQELATIGRA